MIFSQIFSTFTGRQEALVGIGITGILAVESTINSSPEADEGMKVELDGRSWISPRSRVPAFGLSLLKG
jgi:hypothetical protein